MKGKISLIENQDNKLLGLFGFLKYKLGAKMMFSLLLRLQIVIFCTSVYRMATPNGIDCCNNQTVPIGAATTHFDWMGLKCCI